MIFFIFSFFIIKHIWYLLALLAVFLSPFSTSTCISKFCEYYSTILVFLFYFVGKCPNILYFIVNQVLFYIFGIFFTQYWYQFANAFQILFKNYMKAIFALLFICLFFFLLSTICNIETFYIFCTFLNLLIFLPPFGIFFLIHFKNLIKNRRRGKFSEFQYFLDFIFGYF